ncbi:MAG: hypothetical protein LBS10_09110 [Gracilibacteraceae bacterium]|nr:hypothetical protein [Gracilibacteraceae bacterium]
MWGRELTAILGDDSDIRRLVLCAAPVLGNPITVTDKNLRIVAAARYDDAAAAWLPYDYDMLPPENAARVSRVFQEESGGVSGRRL